MLKNSSNGSTSILNIYLVARLFSLEGHLAYATSKAAVEQLTRSLSREIAPLNIRVSTFGLPPLRRALTRALKKEKIDALIACQAIKRLCEFFGYRRAGRVFSFRCVKFCIRVKLSI
ncbi:SDR family oxidoreductase [Pseudomonas chlororaphis]|uniref:SDR family NAD(P)-dependent oxidoreductase n=1 Tax=Pseudomonas chlororaphis TaxID=587753 RepID=UPI001B30D7FE|nr:SDR family oxidoreductase [Pseudomonas chlororaphis]QTT98271.1 SDR family oxidoreductase [Pseudomonas chlororaphis]